MQTSLPNFSRRPHPQVTAFTLLELLVVIALIGALAGLLFPALNAARTRAKRQQALTDVRQVATGLRAFNSDLAFWPVVESESLANNYLALGYTSAHLTNFFLETADLPMSEAFIRRMQTGHNYTIRHYITMDRVNLVTNTSPFLMVAMGDPWGNPYMVRFDYDDNGRIPNPFEPLTTTVVRATVLVWSAGPDKQSDTNGENSPLNRDNIKSW